MENNRYNQPYGYRSSAVRQRKKSATANLYLTIGFSVLAALGALLSVNVFFNLSPQGITVKGTDLYTAEQIQYVGGISGGQNLIRLNTDFIAARLKSNLAYVEDVTVQKEYPNSLVITINQAVPSAQIEDDGRYYTVSESGRVLENALADRNPKYPLVRGYELKECEVGASAESNDAQKTEILTQIFTEINKVGFDKITIIDITDRTDIRLSYDDRIEICLGSSKDLDIKMSYIKSVIDLGLPASYEGTLRYNGIESGISAIPKQENVVPAISQDSSVTDSLPADDSSEEDSGLYTDYNDQSSNTDYSTDYTNGGYGNTDTNTDDYNYDYNDGYDNGYYGYDENNYDYSYYNDQDYNYGW